MPRYAKKCHGKRKTMQRNVLKRTSHTETHAFHSKPFRRPKTSDFAETCKDSGLGGSKAIWAGGSGLT